MSRKRTSAAAAVLTLAIGATLGAAWVAAEFVERTSRDAVNAGLAEADMGWAEVHTDGLQLILSGRAPDERARFRAVTTAGRIVDPGRVVDAMDVTERAAVVAPRFALEILRNDDVISLIGLMPQETAEDDIAGLLADETMTITNMVERVDYAVPDTWLPAVRFAVSALDRLPRAKISVQPGRVRITAVADSDPARQRLEAELARARPDGMALELDIAAPRPVITPFTLRFVIPEGGTPRFEACATDTEAARAKILRVAAEAGFEGKANCVIGLGVPSGSWGEAAALSIAAVGGLGGGSVTLSDADVTLVAPEGTPQPTFDQAVAELETALPDIFSLSAVLPEATVIDGTGGETGTPEFVATLSPEGQVQLRGRLYDQAQETAVLSYGRALFGVQQTYIATRQDENLPQGWPVRVLSALEALGRLESGTVVVQPDLVAVRGITGNTRAEADISRILSDKLGAQANFRIDVEYREELDPLLNIPTPDECEANLNAILLEQKLTFAPGEAVIEEAGDGQIARLTAMLDLCERSVFEIGGHTDSQGREEMNLSLSQSRADAVRAALIARGTSPGQLVSKGYGEAQPVADNDTEAGRETNRRITFTLAAGRGDDAAEADGSEAEDTAGETDQ
ncbi:MAG: OmpA family protein [Jannaschia sp.]